MNTRSTMIIFILAISCINLSLGMRACSDSSHPVVVTAPTSSATQCHETMLIQGDQVRVYECPPGTYLVAEDPGPMCLCPGRPTP